MCGTRFHLPARRACGRETACCRPDAWRWHPHCDYVDVHRSRHGAAGSRAQWAHRSVGAGIEAEMGARIGARRERYWPRLLDPPDRNAERRLNGHGGRMSVAVIAVRPPYNPIRVKASTLLGLEYRRTYLAISLQASGYSSSARRKEPCHLRPGRSALSPPIRAGDLSPLNLQALRHRRTWQ